MAKNDLSDEYFNRSYTTVAGTDYERRLVRYGLFAREAGRLCGVRDVLEMIRRRCPGPVTVRGRADGYLYKSGEIVLTIEGPFGQLVTLETQYLGMLSLSAAAWNMGRIVEAAGGIPVIDMSARHYPPELIPRIAMAAAVGGASGTSTPAGYAEVQARYGIGKEKIRIGNEEPHEFKLYGSIPHALNAVYEGSSIESAYAYHQRCPEVPLTVLIDFEGRERDICSQAVSRFGRDLYAVRLDTAANRIHQGGHEKPTRTLEMRILSQVNDRPAAMAALERYGFGPGVTIEMVYAIRDLLDSLGAKSTRILVSSGFDLEKVQAFVACKAPMDAIGTGSWVDFAMFTSDILRVHEQDQWVPRCKAGRAEELHEPLNMPVLLSKMCPLNSNNNSGTENFT